MDQNEEITQQQTPKEENESIKDEFDEEKRESSEAETDDSEEEDEETTEEESIEEDEPKLKYKRLEADVSELLKKDAASALSVSERFVALGTHNGDVLVLDFDGNLNKHLSSHAASVTDIAIEVSGEYIASASLDGKVIIYSLFDDTKPQIFNYRRPLKCISLDPDFHKKDTQRFVCGGMSGVLNLNEKGWFGQKQDTILQHSGEGPISAVRWKGPLIAYANDEGVKIYNTQIQQRITYIKRPPDSPRADLYRCNLTWHNETTLLVGWANFIQTAVVKEYAKHEIQPGRPTQYVEVSTFRTEFIVCGIAPFNDMTLVLAYLTDEIVQDTETEDLFQHRRPRAKRPELRIINSFNEEISTDALSLHGFQYYQANDYELDYFPSEDMFYVVSPKDLVLAKPRDLDDHISWLLERSRYEEALSSLQEAQAWGGSKIYNLTDLGERYLNYLIEEEEFTKAAENCERILKDNRELWEKWVFIFANLRQLQAITQYIPYVKPQLSSTVYEMVFAHFLNHDHKALLFTITSWPPSIYNVQSVILLVEDIFEKEQDNQTLMECLAELYAYSGQPDKALEYSLRLRRPNVFELIREHSLFSAIEDKVLLLMEFDQHLFKEVKKAEEAEIAKLSQDPSKPQIRIKRKKATDMQAVQLLVDNTEHISVSHVVRQLEKEPYFLHIYLDALFIKDHHAGYEFHDRQIELYAEYDYNRLIEFLRSSNYYTLEHAYKICEQRDLVPEMVFLLGRMGNNKEALMLIIRRMNDVQRAIDFAKEQDDEILWEDLLTYSLDKPKFIIGLLENLGGANIDPINLITRIPNGKEIPGLKNALIKVLQDFNLQASLREGCQKILVSDSVSMANQLQKAQKRGISGDNLSCSICTNPITKDVVTDSVSTVIIFFCRHAFHETCLITDGVLPNPPESSGRSLVGSKVRHTTLLKSLSKPPTCPICNDPEHTHDKQKEKKTGANKTPIRGFVRGQNHGGPREDDGMPPMVPLRL
ncbi:vacuolar assembling protein VPS41 [Rhizophagus clarus]|uniref:Vacuolar protein sorting-associated protein 41 n=1 Tax=Rhizophagus clarus TaxID=94130 RepID=A0A8H3LD06_9GLOM|nr:vacuolar assembling protein VPS41 [Rhizophagus clarus]